jgi:hypothetical protein
MFPKTFSIAECNSLTALRTFKNPYFAFKSCLKPFFAIFASEHVQYAKEFVVFL